MGRDQLGSYEHLVPRPAILFGIYVVLHSFDHRDLQSTWQEYVVIGVQSSFHLV